MTTVRMHCHYPRMFRQIALVFALLAFGCELPPQSPQSAGEPNEKAAGPKCELDSDGQKTCGYNCELGSDGKHYCSSKPDGHCTFNPNGTWSCP